jgi:hypothetical protein
MMNQTYIGLVGGLGASELDFTDFGVHVLGS